MVNNDNEENQCVFDTIDSTEESLKFSEMLMTCANVKIIAGDNLPDQICSTCAQNTIKLYLFKVKCEESDEILRNNLNEGPIDAFMVIHKIEIEEYIFDSLESEIKKENVEAFDDDLADYKGDNGTEESFECISAFQENLSVHRKIAHDEITNKIDMLDWDGGYEINEDKDITKGKPKSPVIYLEDYQDSHKDKKPALSTYGKSSDDLNNVHKPAVLHECDKCKMKFSQSVLLETHKCALVTLRRKHADKKPYKCDLCEKKYKQTKSLVIHRRTHTGEKPYECNLCDRRFHKSDLLNDHKRTHTGEKRYKCDVCESKFNERRQLIIHKRLHTGEKPFKCDACEQTFTQSRSLMIHKRLHTGEKPYECEVCKEKFHRSSALRYHESSQCNYNVPAVPKPYKCDVCEKKFSKPISLKRHKRRNHYEHLNDKKTKKKFI